MDSYTKQQIESLIEFQERFYKSNVISFDCLVEKIRVTAKGIVRRRNKLLVIEEEEGRYYRLIGGGVDFREKINSSLRREFKEELGLEIKSFQYIDYIENIFNFKGIDAHELCFLYDVVIDESKYKEKYNIESEILPSIAKWINRNEFLSNKKRLLPEELLKFI